LGVFNCLRALLPDMIAARDGHIMATSSVSGLLCPFLENHAPYVAAKAGVFGLMLSMRREVEKFGIGATVLCPGAVRTGIADSLKARPARFGGPGDGSVHLPMEKSLLRQRSPEEVAEMVLLAVRNNRAVVVTDGTMKDAYKQCADLVLSAFDDALEFDKERS
jgi:NAD(P)-dependent dehydrogenase (short-subunit alcohol dehydrogenase family)